MYSTMPDMGIAIHLEVLITDRVIIKLALPNGGVDLSFCKDFTAPFITISLRKLLRS